MTWLVQPSSNLATQTNLTLVSEGFNELHITRQGHCFSDCLQIVKRRDASAFQLLNKTLRIAHYCEWVASLPRSFRGVEVKAKLPFFFFLFSFSPYPFQPPLVGVRQ